MAEIIETTGRLESVIKRTEDVYSYRFLLDKRPDFAPGQFMDVGFDKENKELRHYLSISSSPMKEYVEFTKRLSQSQFSQRLAAVKKGDVLFFKLPLGACVYRTEYSSVNFIIGGIGITPVISMLEYIRDTGLDTRCFLIYANRSCGNIAFFDELEALRDEIQLDVEYVLNETSADERLRARNAKCGVALDEAFLAGYKERLLDGKVYIFGPPGFVNALQSRVKTIGVKDSELMVERFVGYE